MKGAIIFDLFNTLIYNKVKRDPYTHLFSKLSMSKTEISKWIDILITNNYDDIEQFYKHINVKADIDFSELNRMLDDELYNTVLFDDTLSSLQALSGQYKLFCLSNIATTYKKPYFDLGLNKYIEQVFFSCDLGYRKPSKEIFDVVIDYIGMDKSQIIMIGDSYSSDFLGATNAGIRPILKDRKLSEIIREL